MSGTTLAFLIVVTVVLGGGIIRLIEKRITHTNPKSNDLERKLETLEQEKIAQLEQRIQTLERIVTDEGTS